MSTGHRHGSLALHADLINVLMAPCLQANEQLMRSSPAVLKSTHFEIATVMITSSILHEFGCKQICPAPPDVPGPHFFTPSRYLGAADAVCLPRGLHGSCDAVLGARGVFAFAAASPSPCAPELQPSVFNSSKRAPRLF